MTRKHLLNESMAMMGKNREVFCNPCFGAGEEALRGCRREANECARMVIRWVRHMHVAKIARRNYLDRGVNA